jgi:hypothetical protein
MTRLPSPREQRPVLTARTRKRILITYAAIGPLLLSSLYLLCRDSGLIPSRGTVDIIVFAFAAISGGYCAFLGLPGHRLVRAGVTVVYCGCMAALVVYETFAIECARGNCL